MRRLYDIVNVLQSLELIRKIHLRQVSDQNANMLKGKLLIELVDYKSHHSTCLV